MYVRVTETVQDRGVLVRPDKIEKTIKNRESDWYCSSFFYGDDALKYWKANKKSIKGYKGEVWTSTLYWDLDCKNDFERVRKNAIRLLEFIDGELDKGVGLEVYYSGNKGVHVLLRTSNKFSPMETSAICYNTAIQAGVEPEVLDTSVYNANRIFRIVNTKHQESGLYKIPLLDYEILESSEDEIKYIAKNQRDLPLQSSTVDFTEESARFNKKPEERSNNIISLNSLKSITLSSDSEHFDLNKCPRNKRKCIYTLEHGRFGSGERHSAIIRMAAYHKAKGLNYDQSYAIIQKALERRARVHPEASLSEDQENQRDIGQVYSAEWKGGMFSCKTDEFLASKCDQGNGPCALESTPPSPVSVVNVAGLFDQYVKYGEEALKDYPKTGIDWIDSKIRIRPRNFSIINGANGSSKTSLMVMMLQNLNRQKIYHIVFSLDMADTSLFEKLGSSFTEYTQEEIEEAFNVNSKNLKVMKEVGEALEENLPYTLFDFTSSVDSAHIENTIITLKSDHGIDIRVGFIDYAGRLIGDHDNEFANSSQNALQANDIAKRTDTHLVYLSQVARDNGDHTTPLRSSRVSKFSGAWEENATFIVNIWRPLGRGLDGKDNYLHVYIAKNRSGSLGEHVFWWEGKEGRVREITRDEFNQYKQICVRQELDIPYEQFHDSEEDNKGNNHSALNKKIKYEEHEEEVSDSKEFRRFSRSKKTS